MSNYTLFSSTQDPVLDDVVAKLKRMKFDSLEDPRSQVVIKPGEFEDKEEAKDWRQETACVCQRPLKLDCVERPSLRG